jgi:hypothetical protein
MIICLIVMFAAAIVIVISGALFILRMSKRVDKMIAEVRRDQGDDREVWKEFIRKVGSGSRTINGR